MQMAKFRKEEEEKRDKGKSENSLNSSKGTWLYLPVGQWLGGGVGGGEGSEQNQQGFLQADRIQFIKKYT